MATLISVSWIITFSIFLLLSFIAMTSKLIKILPLIYLLSFNFAFAQNAPYANLVANYNTWLKSIQLDKLISAEKVEILSPGNVPANPQQIQLALSPAAAYAKPADMAKAWAYVKDGFQDKGIDLSQLLLVKLADYADLPLAEVKIKLQTSSPEVFSQSIFFDKEVVTIEKTTSVRGGDFAIDFDFDAPVLNAVLCGSFKIALPLPDLTTSVKDWKSFFATMKHKTGDSIRVAPRTNESGAITLDISNIFGAITGENYYEKIELTVNVAYSKKQIYYSATISYAPQGNKPPPAAAYRDLAREHDFVANLLSYKNTLETQLQSLYHVSH